MRIRRFVLACLFLAVALDAQRVTITLVATTDLHGNLYPHDYYTAKPAQRGLAKIATLVRDVRRETAEGFRACGCSLNNPNMQLSLLALVVIPELRISDKGLVDVTQFKFIPVLEG